MINVKEKLPKYIITVLETLRDAGFEAYTVGGAVRDMLLGETPNDFDVTTNAKPEETKQVFSQFPTYDIGIKHGTVSVNVGGNTVEVTTYRLDGEYKDSRHPESVEFTSELREDLSRRDFTVNAMAVGLDGNVVDLFGGIGDLEAGIIKCVGDPEKRFTEDALRVMRCFRFAAKLDFEIEESTLLAAEKCRDGLLNISRERIGVEMKKLLLAENCSKTLRIMKQKGITDVILPNMPLNEGFLPYVDRIIESYPRRLAAFMKDVPLDDLKRFTNLLCVPNKDYEDARLMLYWLNELRSDPEYSSRLMAYECRNYTTTVERLAYFEGSWKEEDEPTVGGQYNDPHLLRSKSQLEISAEELLEDFEIEKTVLGALISRILVAVLTKETKNKKTSIYPAIPKFLDEIAEDEKKYGKDWRKLKKYNFK